jgi:hypothetical protein
MVLTSSPAGFAAGGLSLAMSLRPERLASFLRESGVLSGIGAELVTPDQEDDQEDGERDAEEPEECIAADAASLFFELFDGFHAPESPPPGKRFYVR